MQKILWTIILSLNGSLNADNISPPSGFEFAPAGATFTENNLTAVRRDLPFTFPGNDLIPDTPAIEIDITEKKFTGIEASYIDNCGAGCTVAQILQDGVVLASLANPQRDPNNGLILEKFVFSDVPEEATTFRLYYLETDLVEVEFTNGDSDGSGIVPSPLIEMNEEGCIEVSWLTSPVLVLERTSDLTLPFEGVPSEEIIIADGRSRFKQQLLDEVPSFFYRLRVLPATGE